MAAERRRDSDDLWDHAAGTSCRPRRHRESRRWTVDADRTHGYRCFDLAQMPFLPRARRLASPDRGESPVQDSRRREGVRRVRPEVAEDLPSARFSAMG